MGTRGEPAGWAGGALIARLAEVAAARQPGESLLAAVRRDYAESIARADVTLGLSTPAFARMVAGSPALAGRALEMAARREAALGDAIAAETGQDTTQQRLAAAMLDSVHRVLYAEGARRSLAGEPPGPRPALPWPRWPRRHSTCSNPLSAATSSAMKTSTGG